ncbi:MAG: outer membrane beta-barrel protein [Brumimicrobium sp.]
MKKIWKIGLAALIFSPLASFGQLEPTEVRLVGGKNISSFIYKDNTNQKDEQLKYNMLNSFGVSLSLESDKHQLRPELMYRQAGARSDFKGLPLKWQMNYIDLSVGYLYEAARLGIFSLSPGIALNAGYMISGEQYIGDERLSITEEKSMDRFEVGFQGIANVRAFLTEKFTLSLEYRFGTGITQIENAVNDQKTRNIYHGVLLGIGFSLKQEETKSRIN